MKILLILAVVASLAIFARRGSAGAARSAHPPSGEDIRRAILDKRKIEAIKLYRELHRVDLKTAKEAVESLERDLREEGLLR